MLPLTNSLLKGSLLEGKPTNHRPWGALAERAFQQRLLRQEGPERELEGAELRIKPLEGAQAESSFGRH